jgi:hypothetical protein
LCFTYLLDHRNLVAEKDKGNRFKHKLALAPSQEQRGGRLRLFQKLGPLGFFPSLPGVHVGNIVLSHSVYQRQYNQTCMHLSYSIQSMRRITHLQQQGNAMMGSQCVFSLLPVLLQCLQWNDTGFQHSSDKAFVLETLETSTIGFCYRCLEVPNPLSPDCRMARHRLQHLARIFLGQFIPKCM